MTPTTTGQGQLRLEEVYLSGSTGQGPAVVGGICLVADERGLSIVGPEPSSIRNMPWSRVSTMSAQQTTPLPDGRGAVTLEVEIGGQALRFLIPEVSLGPQGIGVLEIRLASIARIPVTAVRQVTAPVALGGAGTSAPGGAGVSAPPGAVMPGPVPSLGAQNPAGPGGSQVWAPPTGGTLLGAHAAAGQPYVQVGKKHPGGRKKRIATVLVIVLILGGAGALIEKMHKGSKTASGSADSLIAAAVNLDPGEVPGWKGISGTTAGVLGAYGFRDMTAGQSASVHQSVLQRADSGFATCTKLPVTESDATLTALGFSDGLGAVGGQTASSASPLFEDPAQASTLTESSALVLATTTERATAFTAFARPQFAPCFSRYLDAVVPDLVGGSMSGTPLGFATVHATRKPQVESGIQTVEFTQTFVRAGRGRKTALSGSIAVLGDGRAIAVLETLTAHQFPASMALKLFASVEQNVAGESP